ncbi:MAG: DsbA family protein [Beijerinckiaceae bacterium]|nr:DsbA family protein [Beijerinckiaceae bacterium]
MQPILSVFASATRRSLLAAAFAAATYAGAATSAHAEFDAGQKAEIQTIIKDYLIKNPDVLRDALIALQNHTKTTEAAQRAKAVADLAPRLLHSRYQVVLGNPKGTIQLVEFFDYNCGYCKRAVSDMEKLISNNPDLRVVLKEFPVLGPPSREAAIVASALHMQFDGKKYWDFHRRLMNTRGRIGKAQALAAAKASGADMAKLDTDMKAADISAGLQEVSEIADTLNMTGTPSYVLGPDVVVGAVGADRLQSRINNLRKCGKSTCS